MQRTRTIALRAGFAVFPGGTEFPARRGPGRVDRTRGPAADRAYQGDAPHRQILGPAHRELVQPQRRGHRGRHAVGLVGLGFRPVEGDAECRAAGAATQAGMLAHAVPRAAAYWITKLRVSTARPLIEIVT